MPHLFVVVQLSPSIYCHVDIAEFSSFFNLRIHTLPVHETIGPRYRLPASWFSDPLNGEVTSNQGIKKVELQSTLAIPGPPFLSKKPDQHSSDRLRNQLAYHFPNSLPREQR